MDFSTPRRRLPLVLDLTPLIDVVFLLLIFFMVTTTFQDRPSGMEVDLPRSSTSDVLPEGKDVALVLRADGTVLLDDRPVDAAGLTAAFREAAQRDAATLVVLRADEGLAHGRVVGVLDLAREEGLTRFAIATSSDDGG